MAISIPVTLAMTFGFMQVLGLDIQQMSIASLIIALGLLVDDPVVAGDAINRELAHGKSRHVAGLAGADQTLEGNPVRDHYKHSRLPALPAADRRRRPLHL
jgi:multidrug efflux pump subunit AcrB